MKSCGGNSHTFSLCILHYSVSGLRFQVESRTICQSCRFTHDSALLQLPQLSWQLQQVAYLVMRRQRQGRSNIDINRCRPVMFCHARGARRRTRKLAPKRYKDSIMSVFFSSSCETLLEMHEALAALVGISMGRLARLAMREQTERTAIMSLRA